MKPVPVGGDGSLRSHARRDAGLDRVVLGGKPERVVAHRMQHPPADATIEGRDGVAKRVVLQMTHMGLAAGIGQHLEDVVLLEVAALTRVRHLPRALARPDPLPLRLDYGRVVTVLGHPVCRLSSPWLTTIPLVTSDSPAASAAAEQVASVLQAAEQAAAQLRLEAEERLRSRIAEGDRAAELRVSAAEEEATEILAAARDEAKRIVSEASSKGLEVIGRAQSEADRLRAGAAKGHDEASWRAQDLMRVAEQTAAEIDIEGMQIVRDLRELGDSLRATPSAYSGTCRRSTPGCWVRSSASQLALHERSGGGRA